MISSIKDCTVLNNGLEMPWLGFGVFQIPDGKVVEHSDSAGPGNRLSQLRHGGSLSE